MNHTKCCYLSLFVAAAAAATGCAADHQGYLMRTDNGQRSAVTFHDRSQGKHGDVDADLASGEHCHGQYNTVPDQVTRNWENPDDIESEDTQIGIAILSCGSHRVVRCNFSKAHEGGGMGECLDTEGRKYSLNF
jgi:hypothetical protein